VVIDTPHLRERTHKLGLIARSAAMFRVDEIIVYKDSPDLPEREIEFVSLILEYLSTPQYLRKGLYPMRPELRYAGVLPPLRTPNHPLSTDMIEVGSFREGVVVESGPRSSSIDTGVGRPIQVAEEGLPVRGRVTVKVERNGYRIARQDEIPYYWGYKVVKRDGLSSWLKRGRGLLVIATSRAGTRIETVWPQLSESFTAADRCLLLFGSPSEGLQEIVSRERRSLKEIADFTLNTIPDQGTATVRTEEAVLAALALVNVSVAMKKA